MFINLNFSFLAFLSVKVDAFFQGRFVFKIISLPYRCYLFKQADLFRLDALTRLTFSWLPLNHVFFLKTELKSVRLDKLVRDFILFIFIFFNIDSHVFDQTEHLLVVEGGVFVKSHQVDLEVRKLL